MANDRRRQIQIALAEAEAEAEFNTAQQNKAASPPETDLDGAAVSSQKEAAPFVSPLLSKAGQALEPLPFERQFGRGAASTVGDLVDLTMKLPLTPGHYLPDESKKILTNALHKNTERLSPKGEDKTLDAAYTAGRWFLPMGKLKVLDLLMPSGAVAGEAIANERGVNPVYGELAGGLIPVGGSLLGSALRGGKALAEKLSSADEQHIANWFTDSFHNPEQAKEKLASAVASKQVGDIADLTQDPGAANIVGGINKGSRTAVELQQLEKQVADETQRVLQKAFSEGSTKAAQGFAGARALSKTMEGRKLQEQGAQQAAQKTAELQRQAMTDPLAVAQQLGGKVGHELTQSVMRQDKVQQALPSSLSEYQKAALSVSPVGSMAETSKALESTVATYKKDLVEKLTAPKWKAFDQSKQIDADGVKATILEGLKARNHPTTKIEKLFKRPEMQILDDLVGPQKPMEISSIASDLKKAGSDVKTEDSWKRILGDAGDLIDEAIAKIGDAGAYKEAKDATKLMKTLIGDRVVSNPRVKGTAEELGRALFKPNEAGAVSANALLESFRNKEFSNPEIAKGMEEYILARAADEGLNDSFMANYSDFFNVWRKERPEFVSRLEDYVGKEQKLAAVGSEIEAAQAIEGEARTKILQKAGEAQAAKAGRAGKRLSEAANASQLAKYQKAPHDTIAAALKADTDKPFKALANAFEKDPQAKADFSQSVGEALQRMGDLTAKENWATVQQRLKSVVGKEGMKNIAEYQLRQDIKRMKAAAGKASYQGNKVAQDIATSAGVYTLLSAFNSSNKLMLSGLFRRTIKAEMNSLKQAQVEKVLDKFITKPETLLEVLNNKAVDENKLKIFIKNWVEEAARSGGAQGALKATAIGQGEE